MKPYNELSNTAKLRRERGLAVAALSQFDLQSPEIAYHIFSTNLLYRVTSASGERFMLRLASPGWRTFTDLQSEALWLNALSQEPDIPAPAVIATKSGDFVLPVSLPGIPGVWNATLMSWIPGRLLGKYLTRRNLEKMGELFARLHQHGAAWVPPEGFTTRRFEHWLSRDEENWISGGRLNSVDDLPSHQRDLLERMDRQVEQAYAALDRADLRVIHCDLWHDNIKLHHGVLCPFDFEDTVWGFRAHDIAMAMLDLLEETGDARYPDLLAAFQRGYQAHLPWPADRFEPFQIGRLLWKINWVANHQRQWLLKMIERHIPVLEHYEQTGQVICPPTG